MSEPMTPPDPLRVIHDRDGSELRKGTLAFSGGERWVIGVVNPHLVRLDRRLPNGRTCSRILGRCRFYCIHPTGIPEPLIF